MNARARLRAGLVLLAVIEAAKGGWMVAAPHSFYTVVPTVSADPPYNQHLMTDVGGLSLALAVMLAVSAARMDRALTTAALAGYLVYAGLHLLFHATHLGRIAGADAAWLLTGLTALPVLAAALLVLAARAGPGPDGRPVSSPAPRGRDSTPAGRDSHGRPW